MVLGDMNYCLDLFKTAGESCFNDPMKAEMYGRCDAACQQIHAKEKLKICEGGKLPHILQQHFVEKIAENLSFA